MISRPANCEDFQAALQATLDAHAPLGELFAADHPRICPNCAHSLKIAVALQAYPLQARPVPPCPSMADRVLAELNQPQNEPQPRPLRLLRVGLTYALALSLVLALGVGLSQPKQVAQDLLSSVKPVPAAPTPRIDQQFASATTAIESLTRRTQEQATAPAKSLLTPINSKPVAQPMPDTPGLPDVSLVARAGIDPVARPTRRAVNLFLRDFGIAPASEKKQ